MHFFENEVLESQRGMEREHSGDEKCIGPATEKHRVLLLPWTAAVGIMDVKEDNYVVEQVLGSCFELHSCEGSVPGAEVNYYVCVLGIRWCA